MKSYEFMIHHMMIFILDSETAIMLKILKNVLLTPNPECQTPKI